MFTTLQQLSWQQSYKIGYNLKRKRLVVILPQYNHGNMHSIYIV